MRWRVAVGGAALLVASACVPTPTGLSHNLVVSYQAQTGSPLVPGTRTAVHGTITNTGATAADYAVQLVSSSGETMSSGALDVLVGQTAVWSGVFTGDVTLAQVKVTSSPKTASPVPAVAVITSQQPTFLPDAPGPVIQLDGTVTNSGTTTASFTIEFQMSSGQVGRTSVPDVPPGQTVPWRTYVFGTIPARILRITAG